MKLHDLTGVFSLGILHLHEAFECLMICDNLEGTAIEIMAVVINCPDYCKLFKLSYAIVLLSIMIASASIADDSFLDQGFSFLVDPSRYFKVLGKDCA